MNSRFLEIELDTQPGIGLFDITPQLREKLNESGLRNGFVNVISRHTTTALTINEYESRLLDDVRQFLTRLAPPGAPYLHDDIHLRDCPQDEPKNAHSHLSAMLLGSSESIPVVDGELMLGTWQSVILIELDGPRARRVGVQIIGES